MTVKQAQAGAAAADVDKLWSLETVRTRCEAILDRGSSGKLEHFGVALERVSDVADFVVSVTRESYPGLKVPVFSRWNQFGAGGVDRVAQLETRVAELGSMERVRTMIDLVVSSILLDASAGSRWTYRESESEKKFTRSDGVAVASFRMAEHGKLSGKAEELEAITEEGLGYSLQVNDNNPMLGLAGRVGMLHSLAAAMRKSPDLFGSEARIGNLLDWAVQHGPELSARKLFGAVVRGLAPIWSRPAEIAGTKLGDVWHHPAAGGSGATKGLVPLHRVAQWVTYSLIYPLERIGLEIVEVGALTGLADHRNGGLMVDMGLLVPKHEEVTAQDHAPGSPIVVEWRALTLALLDHIADPVRERLGLDSWQMPLAKILQGGTWAAGRKLAFERRPDGSPPIRVESNGTVF